jgi:hypothetical protein
MGFKLDVSSSLLQAETWLSLAAHSRSCSKICQQLYWAKKAYHAGSPFSSYYLFLGQVLNFRYVVLHPFHINCRRFGCIYTQIVSRYIQISDKIYGTEALIVMVYSINTKLGYGRWKLVATALAQW